MPFIGGPTKKHIKTPVIWAALYLYFACPLAASTSNRRLYLEAKGVKSASWDQTYQAFVHGFYVTIVCTHPCTIPFFDSYSIPLVHQIHHQHSRARNVLSVLRQFWTTNIPTLSSWQLNDPFWKIFIQIELHHFHKFQGKQKVQKSLNTHPRRTFS